MILIEFNQIDRVHALYILMQLLIGGETILKIEKVIEYLKRWEWARHGRGEQLYDSSPL